MLRAVSWDSAEGSLRSRLKKRIALVAVGAVALAACSSCTSASTPSATPGDPFNPVNFDPSWLTANVNATGAPIIGGTLKIEGDRDVTAFFDPQGEYETIGFELERAYTRQLVSYPASTTLTTAESIVPDAATAMPTVSSDGLTYTFTLRSGMMWNTTPPRPVTSQDFQRGILRNCDPTLAPNGNPGYYVSTIAGFKGFCTAFENSNPAESPAARAKFINDAMTSMSGITTPDSSTIVFMLMQPATDFLNILALPFASAAPIEDLSYVPLTPGHLPYSDGPYKVWKYDVGHEIDLDHNPEWRQSTDAIRHDYVKYIVIKVDLAPSSAPEDVLKDLVTGAADLQWDTIVPIEDIATLTLPAWNPQYGAFPAPGTTNPYLVFNVQSPNNNRALANVKVRQALEYAIDKVAINTVFSGFSGSSLTEPLNQVIGPGAEGYVPFNDYPSRNNRGDPAKCKTLLRKAGVTSLTLKDIYIARAASYIAVFEEVKSDLRRCGVTVEGIPVHKDFYGPTGIGVASADGLKSGKWDISDSPGWLPDWFGPRNGRAILPDLFDGTLSFPGADFGGYDNPAVDALITKAESDTNLKHAISDWHQADELVMADAAFIPLETQLASLFRSARVHNAIYFPLSQRYDLTQVWLSPISH